MKKYLLILFLIFASSYTCAQEKYFLGAAAGFNFNSHNYNFAGTSGSGVGLLAGAVFELEFNGEYGLIVNLSYDDRFGKLYVETPGVKKSSDFKITYITLEAFFKYYLIENHLYVMAGPAFGINSGNIAATTISQNNSTTNTENIISGLNALFELRAGIGYNVPLGRDVILSPRVSWGIGLNKVDNTDWKISTLQVSLALKVIL